MISSDLEIVSLSSRQLVVANKYIRLRDGRVLIILNRLPRHGPQQIRNSADLSTHPLTWY